MVVGRLCLDTMRSARLRRRAPSDEGWIDAADAAVDPLDRVTLDDTVRLALHVVLQRLSPAERTAFVLHDVFQFDFKTVAAIVGRTPAACRQLASRARHHVAVQAEHGWLEVEQAEHRVVTERFITACAGGDLQALLEVLDPDVAGDGTPGGIVPAFPPLVGARPIAVNLLRRFGPESGATLVSMAVRGHPAVFASFGHRIAIVLLIDIEDGRVHHLHAVGDARGLDARVPLPGIDERT